MNDEDKRERIAELLQSLDSMRTILTEAQYKEHRKRCLQEYRKIKGEMTDEDFERLMKRGEVDFTKCGGRY